jgi:hypothetical protein
VPPDIAKADPARHGKRAPKSPIPGIEPDIHQAAAAKREIYVAFDTLRPGELKFLEKATTASSCSKPPKMGQQ